QAALEPAPSSLRSSSASARIFADYRAAWTSSTYGAKSLHRLSNRFGDSCSEGWRRDHFLLGAIDDHSRLKKHGRHTGFIEHRDMIRGFINSPLPIHQRSNASIFVSIGQFVMVGREFEATRHESIGEGLCEAQALLVLVIFLRDPEREPFKLV